MLPTAILIQAFTSLGFHLAKRRERIDLMVVGPGLESTWDVLEVLGMVPVVLKFLQDAIVGRVVYQEAVGGKL